MSEEIDKSSWPKWLQDAVTINPVVEIDKNNNVIWKSGIWVTGDWFGKIWKDGIWMNGNWFTGEFEYGLWMDGNWYNGDFQDGIWMSGIWHKGCMSGGLWIDGVWISGSYFNNRLSEFKYGTIVSYKEEMKPISKNKIPKGLTILSKKEYPKSFNNCLFCNEKIAKDKDGNIYWLDGYFETGILKNVVWCNGIFNDGKFVDGIWLNGYWKYGQFINSSWKKGYWKDGVFNNSIWEGGIWNSGAWNNSENISSVTSISNTNGLEKLDLESFKSKHIKNKKVNENVYLGRKVNRDEFQGYNNIKIKNEVLTSEGNYLPNFYINVKSFKNKPTIDICDWIIQNEGYSLFSTCNKENEKFTLLSSVIK